MNCTAEVFKGKDEAGQTWKKKFEEILSAEGIKYNVAWGGYWNFTFDCTIEQYEKLYSMECNDDNFPAMIYKA